jgi:hypothetical protein
MSPNRVVAVLTPLVASVVGGITAWVANNFPGVEIPKSSLEEVFIGGALIALAPAAQWLHGWQKYEARKAETEAAVEVANAGVAGAPTIEPDFGQVDLDEADFDQDGGFEGDDEFGAQDDLAEFDEAEEFDDELFADEEPAAMGA